MMNDRAGRMRVALRSGLLAGLALAIAEAGLLDGVAWLMQGAASFVAADLRFRIALLLFYPLVVAVVAVLISLLSSRIATAAGAYALLIVMTAHVLTIDPTPSRVAIRALACVIAFIALSLLTRSDALLPLVARHGGWFLAIVSTMTLWIVFESLALASRIVKLGAIAAVMIVAIALVLAVEASRVLRFVFAVAAVGVVAFALTRSAASPPSNLFANSRPAPAAPDIVLVTMDTVRADHVSLNGYPRSTTPFLQELAKTSSVYRHAFAAADMTLSSHASMLTGVWASRHGAHTNASDDPRAMLSPFDGRMPTVAELLRERGYATAAVVANCGYLGPRMGLSRGFEYYDARPGGSFSEGHYGSLRGDVARLASALIPRLRAPYWRRAAAITDESLDVARAARSTGRPLFLFVNYMDAHGPYDPPRQDLARFSRRGIDDDPRRVIGRAFDRMRSGAAPLTQDERAMLIDRYDAGIASIDASVRRLVTSLSHDRDAVVIITADHGEALGEHGLFDHGNGLYQTTIAVPLLIHRSHQRAEVRDEPVSGVDIAATIVDAAGARVPARSDGVALVPGEPIPSRILFSESFPCGRWIGINPRFRRKQVAAIAEHMKFIASTNAPDVLFDLAADPAEEHVLRTQSALARACAPLLREDTSSVPQPLDPETIAQLRSLGYLH